MSSASTARAHVVHRALVAATLAVAAPYGCNQRREAAVAPAQQAQNAGVGAQASARESDEGGSGTRRAARYAVRAPAQVAANAPEDPAAQAQAAQPAPVLQPQGAAGGWGAGGGGADRLAAAAPQRLGSLGARNAAPPGAVQGGALGRAGGAANGQAFAGIVGPHGSSGGARAVTASTLVAIDPNGRFATTYRPGRGNLAAFESSLANGTVPAAARELVGDLGARYAPAIDAPAQGALAFRADLERAALPPSGGLLRLRLGLRSTETAATARPPMSVHLVFDSSGSMSGLPLEHARTAARALVERLAPGDTFSLVRFSSDAQVLVPAGLVGPRRAQILNAISTIVADGGTNIYAGLEQGYAQAARGPQSPETVKIVMLMSDGRATEGNTNGADITALAGRAFQDAVQTSSFGVGTDYDGPLMSSIADQGAGGYYYLRDTTRIAAALATELEARAQPVAQAVEVRVRLRPDVELVQTYGSRRLNAVEASAVRAQEIAIDQQAERRDRIAQNRQHDAEGGMRFFIPGFARDDRHVILLGLRLPAGTGDRPLATVELRYKDRITNRNVTTEVPLRVRFADSDAASLATVDPSVARTVQGFDAGETLVAAARAIEAGDRARATALLNERESLLRASATRLGEPRLNEDAARVGRFRDIVTGGGELSEPMLLALLLDTSARAYMH